jgi:TIR domain
MEKAMVKKTTRTKVFVSYSHADEVWLKRLQIHLKPLHRQGLVDLWDDTRIAPGQKWKFEIGSAINSAAVAILLVSADFLASDFIDKDELPPLLAAAEDKGTMILPLIIGPCRFSKIPSLSQFQALNPPSEPLISMSKADQEQTFVSLTDRVDQLLREPVKSKAGDGEPLEKEITEEGVFHPARAAATRGELHKCKFYISPFYRKTKLWDQLADVLVVLHNSSLAEDVYLIPSGLTNPHLSDARFLRSKDGQEWLHKKRQATIDFVKSFNNRSIDGSRFTIETERGERTKVYSFDYDKFLNATLSDLAKDTEAGV